MKIIRQQLMLAVAISVLTFITVGAPFSARTKYNFNSDWLVFVGNPAGRKFFYKMVI